MFSLPASGNLVLTCERNQGSTGACRSPTGAGRSPTGAGRRPTGACPTPTGASRCPTGATRRPTGACRRPTGVSRRTTGVSQGLSGASRRLRSVTDYHWGCFNGTGVGIFRRAGGGAIARRKIHINIFLSTRSRECTGQVVGMVFRYTVRTRVLSTPAHLMH